MIMNADGSGLTNITNHPSDDSHPKFTRDSKNIIFCSDRDKPGTTPRNSIAELYVMNLEGKELKRITTNGIWNTYPSYSPQSDKIIYRRIIRNANDSTKLNSEVFIMDANGANIKNLTNHPAYEAYPEFSPDGNWILFSSNRNGKPGNYKIYIMDREGENLQQVSFNQPEESDQRGTWSPDGKKIIFNRERNGNVRIMMAEVSPIMTAQVFNEVKLTEINVDRGCSRGLAWGDYNNDELPDLVIANSNNQNLRLFKNLGDGNFSRVIDESVMTFADYAEGVTWIDFDNDHDLDLFVTAHNDGQNTLFRNDSLKRFTKISVGDLTEDKGNSNSSCWCDFDNDGDIDVFVAHKNAPGVLYENKEGKIFRRIKAGTFPTVPADSRTCAWGDIDGDGFYDLFVGNFLESVNGKSQSAMNYLFKNEKGKKFTRITKGDVVTHRARTYGSSFADFDNDGDADLMVTNIGRNDTSYLYINNGQGDFARRYITHGRPSKGHSWGDYNMDGYLDLIVANGTEGISLDRVDDELYYGTKEGSFVKVAHGELVNDKKISAGTAHADVDNDGDLDLVITNWGNNSETSKLYRNDVHKKNWLKVKLVGKKSNSYGIGARATISYSEGHTKRLQSRWLIPQTGYASQNDYIIHFGLGDISTIEELKIHWPSGVTQRLTNVKSNQLVLIDEKDELNKPVDQPVRKF